MRGRRVLKIPLKTGLPSTVLLVSPKYGLKHIYVMFISEYFISLNIFYLASGEQIKI